MRLPEFLKIADILSKSHRITVKEGNAWAANFVIKEVYYKKEDLVTLSEEHILGCLLHEIAHIHYTTDWTRPATDQELHHTAMNVIEDIAIEHLISKDYPNAEEVLNNTRTELIDILIRNLPKMHDVSEHEKSLLYAAVRFHGRGYKIGKSQYEITGNKVFEVMNQRSQEIYERPTTQDLVPLADKIVEILLKDLGQPTDRQKEQMQQAADAHTSPNQKRQDPSTKGRLIEMLGGKGYEHTGQQQYSRYVTITAVNKIIDQAAMIGKKLRTVLKRNNAMEYAGRYRTGKLMTKRLIKVRTIKDKRPFARRIVKSNQSYAFAIASDVSGSMFGGGKEDAASYALSSMLMVGEALRKAGIPRSMIVFGYKAIVMNNINKHEIRWGDLTNPTKIKSAGQSDTYIDRAMIKCTEQLSQVKAERKIMIVLTDGSSDTADMKDAYKKATEKGIECLGITIGGHGGGSMDQVFKKGNTNIDDTSQTEMIGTAFIKLLETTIKKSA